MLKAIINRNIFMVYSRIFICKKDILRYLKWDLNDYKEELGMTLGESLLTQQKYTLN